MKQHTRMNWINGGLFVGLNAMAALALFFTADDAAKWIQPMWLFWIKGFVAVFNNALLGLKTFLSQMNQEEPETPKPNTP